MWGSKMLSQGQAKLLEEAAHHYAQEISPDALQYLEGRGISEEIAARYRLGSIVDPIEGHQGYEGWISIPYFTALDICVGFKFRRLDDGKPKYGAPVGQKSHLFNVIATMSNTSKVVVCEGEFDAIVMEANCQVPAVGVPGVAAWNGESLTPLAICSSANIKIMVQRTSLTVQVEHSTDYECVCGTKQRG